MLSSDELYFLDDESDNDGSDSKSAGTYNFPFRFEDSVGRVEYSVGCVRGVDSGVFVLIGIDLNCDLVPLVVFLPI